MDRVRDELVALLDRLAGEEGFANLRGSMARVPGSAWFRPPPRGVPHDAPDTTTLTSWAAQARLQARVAAQARHA